MSSSIGGGEGGGNTHMDIVAILRSCDEKIMRSLKVPLKYATNQNLQRRFWYPTGLALDRALAIVSTSLKTSVSQTLKMQEINTSSTMAVGLISDYHLALCVRRLV